MYIYKVTNLRTRQFYIGFTKDPAESFRALVDIDPKNKFEAKVHNGARMIMGCEKRFIMNVDDISKLPSIIKNLSTENEECVGVFGLPKVSTKVEEVKPAKSSSKNEALKSNFTKKIVPTKK